MTYNYAVLGAGRQGAAAAYDLAKNGDAARVVLADVNLEQAQGAAARVNRLLGRQLATPAQLDVKNQAAVVEFLKGTHAFVSAVPYYLNLPLTHAAIEARASMSDLGGNTEIVFQQLALDPQARAAGITIVPDCGMSPGLGTSLCVAGMEMMENPRDVFLWDGGLPQDPQPPWNYRLFFHFEGLINEYFGKTEVLRDGKLVALECFDDYELVDFPPPIGQLEAFITAGGTSSAARTFLGKLRTYHNKTLRYKGHHAVWKAFRDAGLFETEPANVKGCTVRPRDLLEAILDPKVRARPGDKDIAIIRVKVVGESQGKKEACVVIDVFDYYDHETGFTAMERTTGWHASIMAILMARGQIARGAVPVEKATTGKRMIEECRARGFQIKIRKGDAA